MIRYMRRMQQAFLTVAGLAILTAAAAGQGITGSITGTVTDSSGATIPQATVTIRQTETNAIRTVTTSDIGSFRMPQLPPGTYSITIDKPQFKTFEQKELVLSIDQVAEVNAQLEIGSGAETVQVTTSAPVIQTETSSVGLVVDSATIQNTPLNGRLNILGLIALAPGVQQAGAQDQVPVFGVTPAIGTGSRNSYGGVGYSLDGVTNMDVSIQRGEGEVPPLDALEEFKVLTTGAAAEFNQPAQVVIVSKGGTNRIHGELLEFNRSKGTSAKEYFNGALPRPQYERNEFGGNINGPIVIPKLYDGRDKSFFFFSYEGFRLQQASSLNTQQPTDAQRGGDFSAYLNAATAPGGKVIQLVNPVTGLPYANNNISQFLNPVSVQLQNILIPHATSQVAGVTNTFELVPYSQHVDRYSFRFDQRLTARDQLHFTFLRAEYGPNAATGTDSLAGGQSGIGETNTNSIVGYTHTFSPTLLLDVNGSFFHLPVYRTPQNVAQNFAGIIPGLGPELIEGAPQISFNGTVASISESGSKDLEQTSEINASVTKVLAKNTIKIGGGYLYDNHWNDAAESPQRGSFTFNGAYSAGTTGAIPYADFLLGYPSGAAKPTPNNYITRNISAQYDVYVQDDYKPTRTLTLNLGLRYDLQWFRNSPYGNGALYIPSLQKVVVFAPTLPAVVATLPTTDPIVLASSVGLPSTLFGYLGQDKNNVAPRFGFAYQARPNTVLRGAVGLFYNYIPAQYIVASGFTNLPYVLTSSISQPTSPAAWTSISSILSATGAFTSNPSVSAQAKTTTPYTEQYNLALEHQFGKGLDIRLGYVGQHNVKQNNYGGSGNVAPDINLPTSIAGAVQPRRLVQPFAAINLQMDPIFHSDANQLQVGVHKLYSNGFSINAEYQWIRVLGTENFQNPMNTGDSYGNIGGIVPQNLVVSYSYGLPFGQGKRFLGTSGGVVNFIVGGWQFSGLSTFQSGSPFSVTYSTSVTGSVSSRANVVPGVPLYPGTKTKLQWFNPAAFVKPPDFTYGTSGYNMLYGPRYQDWDMNLEKNIRWSEHYNLELRADAFNAFNHPNLANPNAAVSSPGSIGTISGINGSSRKVEFATKFSF